MGIEAQPSAVTEIELALDTADLARVGPFWAALLTGSPDSVDELFVFQRSRSPWKIFRALPGFFCHSMRRSRNSITAGSSW